MGTYVVSKNIVNSSIRMKKQGKTIIAIGSKSVLLSSYKSIYIKVLK
jgi:hypothetical protein